MCLLLRLLEEAWCEGDTDGAAAALLKELVKLTHLVGHLWVLHVEALGPARGIRHGSNGLATLAHHLALHGGHGRGHGMAVVSRDARNLGSGAILNWFNAARGLGFAVEEADNRHATVLARRRAVGV